VNKHQLMMMMMMMMMTMMMMIATYSFNIINWKINAIQTPKPENYLLRIGCIILRLV